jgi:predicted GNAT family acetyltransferase
MDRDIISRLNGRITPAFSWDDTERFLKYGKGFCVMCDGEPVSWAFTAAVSSTEEDIGTETVESHRRKGLAAAAAAKTAEYIIAGGKAPVWACHCGNAGSQKTAAKIGFVKDTGCTVISMA